jgi:hypothetical protein
MRIKAMSSRPAIYLIARGGKPTQTALDARFRHLYDSQCLLAI